MAFATTRWSLILAAQSQTSDTAQQALATLCEAYWFPLYSYVRGRGYRREEAQDLAQAYFVRFIEKTYITDVDRDKGRFRSFLLTSLKHFLADEWDKATAQKRGGGSVHIPLDFDRAEDFYTQLPATNEDPERLYDKQWAQTLLSRALSRLQDEQQSPLQRQRFEVLKQVISVGDDTQSYTNMGAKLGMDANAVKVAAHRLRRRYREIVLEETSETLQDPSQAEAEISYLISLFGR